MPTDPADPPRMDDRAALRPNIVASQADGGRIAENILMFARVLRAAGLPAGPQQTVTATEAVLAAGIGDPKILYWTLHAAFVSRRADHEIFHQAFHLFWRDPGYLQQLLSVLAPNLRQPPQQRSDAMARRLADSLFTKRESRHAVPRDRLEIDARGTISDREAFETKDFEQMSADEMRLARDVVRQMGLLLKPIATRRYAPSRRPGRLDIRRMLRQAGTRGPNALLPFFRAPRRRPPPLVVLCDISGSMDAYARIFLHFLYAMTNEGERVHAFLFGTRLSNVTRALRDRDPDAAIARIGSSVRDWSGGTRIGDSLAAFNRHWARRVLGQNATVLLCTDGLDRVGGAQVDAAARRLRASSRRLIWLNPLLRCECYKPLASGARDLAKNASEIVPCHSLASIADLGAALSGRGYRPNRRT